MRIARIDLVLFIIITSTVPHIAAQEEDDLPGQKGLDLAEIEAITEIGIEPGLNGTVHSALPVAYHETTFHWFIDAREAAHGQGWACGNLPELGSGPAASKRCHIIPITGLPDAFQCEGQDELVDITEDSVGARYVFNSNTPVLVERPASGERFVAHYVQFNNWTGQKRTDKKWDCPWNEETGPASWIQKGGDEFIAFRTPATPAGARGEGVTLENDHLRPDDGWMWQMKAAVWEADRGPDGRMTLFAKRTDEGVFHGGPKIQINQLVFKRTDDPFSFNVNTWETMFWNCERPCVDPTCTAQEMAECDTAHGYRLTDISLVDEKTTTEWDYVGVLSWNREINPERLEAGATAVRIKSRAHTDIRNLAGEWVRVPWGGEIEFALERTVQGRTAAIFEVTGEDGRKHHELWRIRADVQRGGVTPCGGASGGDESAYAFNLSQYPNPTGFYSDFFYFDAAPENLTAIPGGPYVFDSQSVRDWHLPTDYNAGYTWVLGRLELEDDGTIRDYFYMGTRDALICTHPIALDERLERGTGKGIAVAELVRACSDLFCESFESGNLLAWSSVK